MIFHVSVQKLNQGKSLEIKYFADVGVVFFLYCLLWPSFKFSSPDAANNRILPFQTNGAQNVKVRWSAIALNSLCIFSVI